MHPEVPNGRRNPKTKVSLEVHEPTGSLDNVSGCTILFFPSPSVYLYVLLLSGVDEEIRRLGH
jgi:hypothetical protein